MNFNAYIERQKNIIRSRHEGELFLLQKGQIINVTETDKLFEELKSLKGLNRRERAAYGRAV